MLRDGRERTTGSFKVCIATDGHVSFISVVGSTKYPDYDATIVANVRNWRYQPYRVDGVPVPACSVVTFNYSMR
jgi:TonB family protein